MTLPSRLEVGETIAGDFVVVRPLDQGGMGTVYVVEQKSTGKVRALKTMHRELTQDPDFRARFEREAKIGARIASDHVVEVIAAGVDRELPWLAMELLEGETLHARLRRDPPPSLAEAREIFEQLCHALAAAHREGIVHRDLKPENVFLAMGRRASGSRFAVKVLDFGIAKLADGLAMASSTGALGSPLWMAPEQSQRGGAIGPTADIWALGLLAYTCLTRRIFWNAHEPSSTSTQLLREILIDPIPSASERARTQGAGERLPLVFDAWFARAVTREASDRWANAGQAWIAMQGIFEGERPAATAPDLLLPAIPTATGAAVSPRSTTETPAVRDAPPAPKKVSADRRPAAAWITLVGAILAVLGILLGIRLQQRARRSGWRHAAATATPPPIPTPVTPSADDRDPEPISSSPRPTAGSDGFIDPVDRARAAISNVSGHHVRLFTRIVQNRTNLADDVVRDLIDHDSWKYAELCYAVVFAKARALPRGTTALSLDIYDQLPKNVMVESSDLQEPAYTSCMTTVLSNQTMNAAGPEGRGHVVYAFRFVPID